MIPDCPKDLSICAGREYHNSYRHAHLPDGTVLARWSIEGRGNVLLFYPTRIEWGDWSYHCLAMEEKGVDEVYEAWKRTFSYDS